MCVSPSSLAAAATRAGSSGSSGRGMPVRTLQKAQARVQVSPMIMKVAWRLDQHSPMLGQPASSHTVVRPWPRTMRAVSACAAEPGARTRIHAGLAGRCRGAVGSARRAARSWRARSRQKAPASVARHLKVAPRRQSKPRPCRAASTADDAREDDDQDGADGRDEDQVRPRHVERKGSLSSPACTSAPPTKAPMMPTKMSRMMPPAAEQQGGQPASDKAVHRHDDPRQRTLRSFPLAVFPFVVVARAQAMKRARIRR